MDELKVTVKGDRTAILDKIAIVEDLTKALHEDRISSFHVEFPTDDPRLNVQQDRGKLIGRLLHHRQAALEENVVCEAIDESQLGMNQTPRHALIYAKLSARILVQPFYGIAQRQNRKWAVMADLSDCKTLHQAIYENDLVDDTIQRLDIARHVTRTVNYLHSVDILVKNLSDENIVLKQDRGEIKPILVGLEQCRLVRVV